MKIRLGQYFLGNAQGPTKEEITLGTSSLKYSSLAVFEVRSTVPS